MQIIRPAAERGHANFGWLDSHHSFSFGNYYDPAHMGFSDLRVINEDRVTPGAGFGTHPHRDMEILSYVLDGAIAHKDSMGNVETVPAGEFQIMSAGTGVTHSEFNPLDAPLHFLQIWIMPNQLGIDPRYDQKAFANAEGGTLILSPDARDNSLKVYQDMCLWRYQYSNDTADKQVSLDAKRRYWIQMVRGDITVNGDKLSAGDGLAIVDEESLTISNHSDSEFLLFDLR